MVKEAFQRLSPERQEELLYKGMMLYLKNPYDQVTVRMLAAAMEINMATFYRYFDEKEDLSLLILRRIQRKYVQAAPHRLFEEFPEVELSAEEQAYINRLITWPDDALQRAYFEGAVECNMPVIVRQLQMERLDGRLRDNVIDDLIAYLYVTLEYNLLRYLRRNGGFDEILFIKLKDYLLHSLLPHGIFKMSAEAGKDEEDAAEKRICS